MLFGMIKEVAGKYTDSEIDRFAQSLTESQIQFIVDRYMGYSKRYNQMTIQYKRDNATKMAKWANANCFSWAEEAGQWAMRPAGLSDDGTEIA